LTGFIGWFASIHYPHSLSERKVLWVSLTGYCRQRQPATRR